MSTAITLQAQILSSNYEDLHQLVYRIVHKMAAKFGVHFDDLVTEAHCIFVRECSRFDPTKGTQLSSWIYSKVTWGLISFMRSEFKHRNLANADDLEEAATNPDTFLLEFQSELSADARNVVELVLDSKDDFAILLRWNKPTTRAGVVSCLHEHLRDLGWSLAQIHKSFHEISTVLRDEAPEIEAQDDTTPERLPRWMLEPNNTLRALEMDRQEAWMLSRVGMTPSQVRSAFSKYVSAE